MAQPRFAHVRQRLLFYHKSGTNIVASGRELRNPAKADEIIAAWNEFRCLPQKLKLPSAPEQPVIYDNAPDRPQPRLDRDRGHGMSAVVGRLRPCNIFDWRFTVLSHNTIRGAAGAAILNGELLKAQGYIR